MAAAKRYMGGFDKGGVTEDMADLSRSYRPYRGKYESSASSVANGKVERALKANFPITPRMDRGHRTQRAIISEKKYKSSDLAVVVEEPLAPDLECFSSKIGLSCLPYQSKRIYTKKQASFNLMVMGSKFTGKTTFINTLFGENLMESAVALPGSSMYISKFQVENGENSFNLSIIDTKESSEHGDYDFLCLEAAKYIDERHRLHIFKSELSERSQIVDDRVHCCIYFLDYSGGVLTQSDIKSIKGLYRKVNLIPVVGKSDTFTLNDLLAFKDVVKKNLEDEGIYLCDFISDEDVRASILKMIPYSIIGSTVYHKNKDNKLVRGRKYLWGIAEVDNETHCDFCWLERVLFKENMLDLILATDRYYESYRKELLTVRYKAALNQPVESVDITENGFSQLLIYHKTGLDQTEKILTNEDEILNYKQKLLEGDYGKKINTQEEQFRLWKRKLVEKQKDLNTDIKTYYAKYLELKNQILMLGKENNSSVSESSSRNVLGDMTISELKLFNIN